MIVLSHLNVRVLLLCRAGNLSLSLTGQGHAVSVAMLEELPKSTIFAPVPSVGPNQIKAGQC